jgi:cation/acetate symporter
MDLQTLTITFVALTFALYMGIAYVTRAKSTKEFYVAGGSIGPIGNGMATAADWMSAASFISMAGLIAFYGYGGAVFLLGWTGGYVLLAAMLAPYLRKHGVHTVPQFIGERYLSQKARLIGVVCLIIASVTYIIGQMKGVGVAFSRFLEVDYNTGLTIGIVIVTFYAVVGGMKGITYTQMAQYVVMIFAYTIPAIFISLELTGNPIPQLGLGGTFTGTETFLLDKLDQIQVELGFAQYTTQARLSGLNMFVYTVSLMIGTAGLPHVIMRFFTVKTVKAARASAGWALIFIAILYTTAPALAAMAKLNLMNTIENPTNVAKPDYKDITDNLVYAERPVWFKKWEETGLLKFQDKNGDGRIQYSSDKTKNEMVKIDRDIMVLANPEIAMLPNWVIALVAAGGLAAALSTAAGLLLAISSSIAKDLFKGVLRPDMNDQQELNTGRIAMLGAVAVSGYFGFFPPDFAAGTVALAFGLAASSIFPVLMMGIFSKKMNSQGAVAGMAAGMGITLLYVFQHKGIMFIKSTAFLGDMPQNWFLGIEPNAFGAIGAIVNFAVAIIVYNMTKGNTSEKDATTMRDIVENMREPERPGESLADTSH